MNTIENTTLLKDFPSKYNENITELLNKIKGLEDTITDLETKHNSDIAALNTKIINLTARITELENK